MGIFDKAKDLLNQHNDKVDQGIEKAANLIDEKTGRKHSDQIGQATQRAKDAVDDVSGHPRDSAPPARPAGDAPSPPPSTGG